MLKQLGDGTYGSVWKAINLETNAVVGHHHLLCLTCSGCMHAYSSRILAIFCRAEPSGCTRQRAEMRAWDCLTDARAAC